MYIDMSADIAASVCILLDVDVHPSFNLLGFIPLILICLKTKRKTLSKLVSIKFSSCAIRITILAFVHIVKASRKPKNW